MTRHTTINTRSLTDAGHHTRRFLPPALVAFFRRVVSPAFGLSGVMQLGKVAYGNAHRVPIHLLHQVAATVGVAVYFTTIALGALYVYTSTYRRGASVGERILAASLNPLLWMTGEVGRVAGFYSLPDALFFYVNPLHVSLVGTVIAEMGIAELACRFARRRRGESVRVFSPVPVVAIALPLLVLIPTQLPPENAAASFFVFLKLYARIVHGTSLDY